VNFVGAAALLLLSLKILRASLPEVRPRVVHVVLKSRWSLRSCVVSLHDVASTAAQLCASACMPLQLVQGCCWGTEHAPS
jgi:hypothetical protein